MTLKRKLKQLSLALTTILCCCFLSAKASLKTSLTLQQAVTCELIHAEFKSLGTSSEYCVNAELRNLSDRSLSIAITPGLLLQAVQPDFQDVIIVRNQEIELDAGGVLSVKLFGFCHQAGFKPAPLGTHFMIVDNSDPKMLALAAYLDHNEFTAHAQQEAIWTISNDFNLAGIVDRNHEKSMDLRYFCGGLLGKVVPWYSIDYGDLLNVPFEAKIQRLSGQLDFTIERECTGDLVVVDPDGEIMITLFKDKKLRPASYEQNFDFEATLLEPGEYHFQILVDGVALCDRTIEL